jgi:hypothetical protein
VIKHSPGWTYVAPQIPSTGFENLTLQYFSTDNPERHFSTPFDSEIEYRMNRHGYRSAEFDRGETTVMVLGCSIAFGNGVPQERRFGEIFADHLASRSGKSVTVHNLAWPGESVDYVARLALLAIPVLKPDVLLVNFPHFARREYFTPVGGRFDHRPERGLESSLEREIHSRLNNLSSVYQDSVNFLLKYKLIEGLTRLHGVRWIYSILKIDRKPFSLLADHVDEDIRASSMNKIDYARDGGHPGVQTHSNMGKSFFEKYCERYDDQRKMG